MQTQSTFNCFAFTFNCFAAVLLLAPALTACDTGPDDLTVDDFADTEDDDLRSFTFIVPPTYAIPTGTKWGPCDLTDVDDPDWWGCDGELGEGLACARPVSDNGLNICVPQTFDPTVPDDCSGLTAPFGLGVRKQGSAYCVVDCNVDADCAGGMACSASSHICAWLGG